MKLARLNQYNRMKNKRLVLVRSEKKKTADETIITVCLTQLTDTGFVIGVTSVGYSFNVVQILIERSGQPDTAAVSAIILGKSEIYHRGGGTNDTFPGYAWEL